MRIVGGSARGRRLVAPPGAQTRPTSDRARESVMNILWSRDLLDGATVLDLFAGSGALGIEALSRGAVHATFVDDDRNARRAIETNLATCGFTDRADVVADRAERYLARSGVPIFDLAFCDPPYAYDGWDELLPAIPAAWVVIESAAEVALPPGWEVVRANRYGAAWIGLVEGAGGKKPEVGDSRD
jgi:16S rRNA (guanine966-N2)-methyltransferase